MDGSFFFIPRFLFRVSLIGWAFALPMQAQDDYRPTDTQKEGEHPPTPVESLAMIEVPPGFHVSLFAAEPNVRQPIAMEFDDRGRLWVAECYSYKEWQGKGEDRILIFEDSDGDGSWDKRSIFWDEGMHLSGFTLGAGGVWVCDSPNLLFIPDADLDGKADGSPEIILDGWTTKAGHNFYNGLCFGPDGWLYGRHGITAPSLVGPPGTPSAERTFMDCSIWRWHPVWKRFELVVRGTTNPWGLDWDQHGELFMSGNVNGHLWHVVPGARYKRMHGAGHVPYTYERMVPATDHLHHEGTWTDRTNYRDGKANDVGGGHSQCGLMIYQGANFPDAYRGLAFMCNTHGNRINSDRLEQRSEPEPALGGGYIATHGDDFFVSKDRWFRGTTVISGPDGSVYVSDWSDLGECHDNDGVHRSSGRIYNIRYGEKAPLKPVDLQTLSLTELEALLFHEDIWFRRKANRILTERARAGENVAALNASLRAVVLDAARATPDRLNALWTLYACAGTDEAWLLKLVAAEPMNPHLQVWAVRLLGDAGRLSPLAQHALESIASRDLSILVRHTLASALQRIPLERRRALGQILAADPSLAVNEQAARLLWYGIEPLMTDISVLADFLPITSSPMLCRLMARRYVEDPSADLGPLVQVLLGLEDTSKIEAALVGMGETFRGRKGIKRPENWSELEARVAREKQMVLTLVLAKLGPSFASGAKGLNKAVLAFADSKRDLSARKIALQTILQSGDAQHLPILFAELTDPEFGPEILTGLAGFSDPRIAEELLSVYDKLPIVSQSRVLQTLASRRSTANALLDAIRKQRIPKSHLRSTQARQIHAHNDSYLRRKLALVYGEVDKVNRDAKKEILAWEKKLSPELLANADRVNGKAVFERICASCHEFNGAGEEVGKPADRRVNPLGPDLTGSNRGSVYYLLENIIDPNAIVPHDFRLATATLRNGQVVAGVVTEDSPQRVVLQMIGSETVIPRGDLKHLERLKRSIMPEGLIKSFKENELRDLIGYLQAGR